MKKSELKALILECNKELTEEADLSTPTPDGVELRDEIEEICFNAAVNILAEAGKVNVEYTEKNKGDLINLLADTALDFIENM